MSEVAAPQAPRPGTARRILSDERLAQRATKGDRRALAAIYRRYHQDLYRFCLAIVGNSQDAQDALQNTMVKVLRSLPGEERRIRLKPWLYRIAHNESVALLRKRRAVVELDPEQAAAGPGLAEEAAARDRLRRLIGDLEELPERQRAALVMRELAGLEFAEIAAALDTSAGTARQTVYEARLSLHEMEGGREMSCASVTKALSDADGRVTRRRDIRSHLRGCPSCRAFRTEIEGRRHDLAALAPLPAVAATGLLQGILGGGTAKAVGASALFKSVTAVAVVAAVGVSADRSGVVDVGLPGGGSSTPASAGAGVPAGPATAPAGRAGQRGNADDSNGARGGGQKGLDASRSDGTVGAGAAIGRPGEAGEGTVVTPRSQGSANGLHKGRGHEKGHPAAAAHGQQTAAAHKGGKKSGHSKPAHPSHPPKPAHPAKPAQPVHPPKPAQPTQPAQPTEPAGESAGESAGPPPEAEGSGGTPADETGAP
jgi:RNA polymerase sigma factor (sigma-70 family)